MSKSLHTFMLSSLNLTFMNFKKGYGNVIKITGWFRTKNLLLSLYTITCSKKNKKAVQLVIELVLTFLELDIMLAKSGKELK